MASASRVMIIGWDCAPPQFLLGPYLHHMPNFRRLVQEGVAGPLRSSDPPITVPAWTCMMSSVNPGGLGFYGFRNRRPGEYDGKWIANSSAVKVPRVWDLLSDAGRKVCVLNVPQTYPVSPVNGVMVSCFLTPDTSSEYTYPSSLKPQIERIADGYIIDVEDFRTEDKRHLLDQIYLMTDKRFKVACALLQVEDWDFFMMVEMGPDRLGHGFWKYCDPDHPKYQPGNEFETAMLDYYVHLDEQLGRLLELAGEDTAVLVVSDHGGKAMRGSFCLNDWLIREGLLTLRQPVSEVTGFDADLVDWERTTAWAWGGYYGRVFLNIKGREPQGTIAPGDVERVREDLIARLKSVPDHEGRPMNTQVVRPEDVYSGPYVHEAPDLQVYMDDLYWRLGQDIGHEELYTFDTEIGPDDSVHDYYGIIAAHLPGDHQLTLRQPTHLMDIAPTVLELLGLPVPPHMEGHSLLAR